MANDPGQLNSQMVSMPAETSEQAGNATDTLVRRNELILQFHFALLSALCGVTLGFNDQTQMLPILSIGFAIAGFVLVDWLRWLALPSMVAYAAMILAAAYCINDFLPSSDRQMVAVAQLLVMVQAILLMQRKSRRVHEQLGVFCLLQLVVAAVFNNALTFGFLLIPITLIGGSTMCLMQLHETFELSGNRLVRDAQRRGGIKTTAGSAFNLVSGMVRWVSWSGMCALIPSMLFLTAIFFYGLPRTGDASRFDNGTAIIGFADSVQLRQIGQMLKSNNSVMRVRLQEQDSGSTYELADGLYLRGKTLELYRNDVFGNGEWESIAESDNRDISTPPQQFQTMDSADRQQYDRVLMHVQIEPMSTDSLFSVAPYHRLKDEAAYRHVRDHWTLRRRGNQKRELKYKLGTHAFHNGLQTEFAYRSVGDSRNSDMVLQQRYQRRRAPLFTFDSDRNPDDNRPYNRFRNQAPSYREYLLQNDPSQIPIAARMAQQFAKDENNQPRNDYQFALAVQRYLSTDESFSYTTNLDMPVLEGVDPIQHFLATTRRGHCQFFAAGMAMILRSHGIPCRLVVGYRTEERSQYDGRYIVRQLHAHAWLEALLDRNDLPEGLADMPGQPVSSEVWMRLDPTPGRGGVDGAGVNQLVDLAQNIWDDYVVDVSAQKEVGTEGSDGLGSGFQRTMW
ncbi:MAG: DUF3488 and transglutaminase-like domain-containing protein [Planctomycetota bacterium]